MLLLKEITGARTKLNFGALARDEGESDYCVANPYILKNLGWNTKTSLEQGLRKVVASLDNY
jgi:dTDP-D-glucose 4,6-dehydratase